MGAAKRKKREEKKAADIMESKGEEAWRQPCFAAKVYTYFPPFCFICPFFFLPFFHFCVFVREPLGAIGGCLRGRLPFLLKTKPTA